MGVILYDTVVNHVEFTIHRNMRMCIVVTWFTVGSPPSMPYPYSARYILAICQMLQVLYFPLTFIDLYLTIEQGKTRRIISTVFKSLQAFHQNRKGSSI